MPRMSEFFESRGKCKKMTLDRQEKLRQMTENVRIGGKGTVRRKKKIVHKGASGDDKKLQSALKKIQMNAISQVEEVDMFKSDGSVMIFKQPKVQASYGSNMYSIVGQPETKKISDILAELQRNVAAEQHSATSAQKVVSEQQKSIPDDFEAISLQE
uniref:Transcription factor BTF3 n=1 Tax=Henneguya salminicola TaxID=69463 RepID=A0A6G3MKA8_HENSL